MEIDTHNLSPSEGEADIGLLLLTLVAGIAIGVVVLWTIETADAQQRTAAGVRPPFAKPSNGTKPSEPEAEVGYTPPADLEIKHAQSTG